MPEREKDLVLALGLEEMVHFPGYLKFPAEAVKMCAYSLGVISNLRWYRPTVLLE